MLDSLKRDNFCFGSNGLASPALVWFRDDHRLGDNPALTAAIASGQPVLCFAIIDEESPGLRPLGGAARWWLHGSLKALNESLERLGSSLLVFRGEAPGIVETIVSRTNASAIYWNRRYAAAEIAVDTAIKERMAGLGIEARSFNGRLLHEPWQVMNQAGKPFQVFTPYLRAVMKRRIAPPLPAPKKLVPGAWSSEIFETAFSIDDLGLLPVSPDWASGICRTWKPGEAAARKKLADFLDDKLESYVAGRDIPSGTGTSRLSPHLRFGEISPGQVWHAVQNRLADDHGLAQHAEKFLSEVVWRDFCHQLLHTYPHLPAKSHSPRFESFPWISDKTALKAWQEGRTGYPIVDAGMRQLWRTGWMHNRVRMIAASFLVKHLLTDWRHGEKWFWDTLVDADSANNAFSWQWIAGSGPDSAPFHRIFNPVSQGEKFDSSGDYVRTFVPEIAGLPDAFIHKPWEAPFAILSSAGIEMGKTYPSPIVPHAPARERALQAFRSLRGFAHENNEVA
ncbi:deoxyribodipyrimidine photo-lyase [Microvirga sp. 2YAF29]|uniref:cryptochrome/photolyase family protein n=1 Tax=Microvirga sp. 2YAF29 TaxID=3233031 RepID=UPI003F9E5942